MKVLVTGYKGYIGSHIYQKLKELKYDVKGIDLKDGEDIFYCLPKESYDCVFHLAACPRVGYSIKNPSYTMRQNVLATSVLLEWAKNYKIKRIIFSSSAAVMGDGDGIPKSPYGLHKLISEMECRMFSELYGLDTVCLRYFNVYSGDQEYGGSYSTAICAWMEMIRQKKPLRIDGDGEQIRDLVHVDDIVSANIFCMKYPQNFNGKTFSVASGTSVSLNYIKRFIDQNYDVVWHHRPERIGDIKESMADISELRRLGWVPKISIEEGLKRSFAKKT
tara:strand:- start:77 stop:904 length:828 start_codon:yes stop_codon:yes gene_type:complete